MDLNISRQYRHMQRYRQIAQILLTNGFGFIIDWLDLKKYLPFKDRFNTEEEKYTKKNRAVRLRKVLQELGPTYIKLGQLISTRADILSPEYINELSKLQDRVPVISFNKIEKVLIEELGPDYQSNFLQIKTEVKAAASIAQIYQAVLTDGREVVLKIQRPDIRQIINSDMDILENLAQQAEERKLFPSYIKPIELIKEFKNNILEELDFRREVANINKFRDNFKGNEHITVPVVNKTLSTSRLIVMEEIKGIKLTEFTRNDNVDNRLLARIGAKALMKQVLIDGFFHADPHPGNIFIVDKNKLAYLDFGLMGRLTPEDQDRFTILFIALLKKNVNVMVDILTEIGVAPRESNLKRMKLDIQDLLNLYYEANLKDINFVEVIEDLQKVIYKYHIRMPVEFFLLARAIGVSEGIGHTLDPSFNIVEVGNEFVLELLEDRLRPDRLVERIGTLLWNLRSAAKGVPAKADKLLNKFVNDDFTIKFKHINLENLVNKLDIISNRLSISLIITALIIGSTMILQTNMHPLVLGIPVLGFLGYILAGILGFWLVIAILKSGRF